MRAGDLAIGQTHHSGWRDSFAGLKSADNWARARNDRDFAQDRAHSPPNRPHFRLDPGVERRATAIDSRVT